MGISSINRPLSIAILDFPSVVCILVFMSLSSLSFLAKGYQKAVGNLLPTHANLVNLL